jgi:IMP cyclohydrolase
MRHISKSIALTLFSSAAAFAMPQIAHAADGDPPYVGTWGVDAEHCKTEQDKDGAPYIFRKDGYDQHEAHCAFKTVTQSEGEYKFTSECSVEGDVQSDDTVITVSGDTLRWGDGSGAPDLMRCK